MQGVEGDIRKPTEEEIDMLKILLSPDSTEEKRVSAIQISRPTGDLPFPGPSARDAPLQGEIVPLSGSSQSRLVWGAVQYFRWQS